MPRWPKRTAQTEPILYPLTLHTAVTAIDQELHRLDMHLAHLRGRAEVLREMQMRLERWLADVAAQAAGRPEGE